MIFVVEELMLLKFKGFLVFTVLFGIPFLSAMELDLEAVIRLAKEQNKELKLARAEFRTADANVKEAWSQALPTIDATFNYNRNFKQTYFYVNTGGGELPNRFSFSFNNEYSFNTTLKQTIYSFGKVGTALKIAYDYKYFVENQFSYQHRCSSGWCLIRLWPLPG
jgi:hypothetical protein